MDRVKVESISPQGMRVIPKTPIELQACPFSEIEAPHPTRARLPSLGFTLCKLWILLVSRRCCKSTCRARLSQLSMSDSEFG